MSTCFDLIKKSKYIPKELVYTGIMLKNNEFCLPGTILRWHRTNIKTISAIRENMSRIWKKTYH